LNENFPAYHLCTAQTFHSNSPVRLKKSLWESRTTATLRMGTFLTNKTKRMFLNNFDELINYTAELS
jgi:hypothetical protein